MSDPEGRSPQYEPELLDSVPAIVWIADPGTLTFLRVSHGAELILGYRVEEWLAPGFWLEHVHPDDRQILATFQSQEMLEKDRQVVYRMTAADGRIVWLRDRVRACTIDGNRRGACGVMLDISAERRAYEALARSEENYRRLVDTAPDAIGVHTGGRFVYVNPKFVEVFGAHDESDILGRQVLSLVDPEYREIVRSRQAQVAIGDTAPMTREKLIRVDGSPFDAEVMAIPVVYNGARAVQVIARDITQRVRMAERMQLLAAGTNEAIWEGDYRTGEFWSNDRYRSLFGPAPDFTAAQRKWTDAIHPDDRERMTTLVRERAERGIHQWSEEYRIRTLAGQYIWVLDRGRRVTSDGGTPLRVIGALLDVTPQRESEQHFRQIVEQVQDVIFTLDTDARVTSLNPAFERITGYTTGDWIGRPIVDIIVPEDHEKAKDHFRRAMQYRGEPPRQYRIRTASGTIEVEGTAQPLVVNDEVVGTTGIARDVTERNLLERKLDDARHIASLGSLAASIAHEFDDVLTAIEKWTTGASPQNAGPTLSRTGLQRRTGPTGESDLRPSREASAHIAEALERGKRITGEILLYASPEPAHLEVIDPVTWLRPVAASLRAIVPETITIAIDPRTTEKILADRVQLEQVLTNLTENARDAMPSGGALTIDVVADGDRWRKRAALDPDRHYVRISVCDTGSGIHPDALPEIFEPLFTTKRGGTGLGLAIAKRLVESQNGAIAVDSTVGAGTSFHLFLPTAPDPDRSAATTASH